jgi:ATP-dependent Clp protease protease subunit
MYNRLKQHNARVTVYVDGLAASIASIIAMAADEIVVYASSTIMIHKPLTYTGGNAEQLQEVINRLNLVEGQMLDIYVSKTGLDREHVKNLLSAETWMTSEEAIHLGFADRLEATTQSMAAAVGKPNLNKPWFSHAPKAQANQTVSLETIRRAKAQSASLVSRSR